MPGQVYRSRENKELEVGSISEVNFPFFPPSLMKWVPQSFFASVGERKGVGETGEIISTFLREYSSLNCGFIEVLYEVCLRQNIAKIQIM